MIHKYNKWIYLIFLIPLTLAILALNNFGFFFKSGTAGVGILILLFAYRSKFDKNTDVWMVIVAFAFSIAGDWFLSNMNGDANMFVSGIALFFVAHVGYLSYALMNGKITWIFTGIVLTGFLIFYFISLFPSIDEDIINIAAFIYLLISCFSMGAAVGIEAKPMIKWSYVFGILLVLFSDTIISLKEFVGYTDLNFLILPTYYLAHISITFSLFRKGLSLTGSRIN